MSRTHMHAGNDGLVRPAGTPGHARVPNLQGTNRGGVTMPIRTDNATPEPGTVWLEEVIHATCANCGRPLRRHPDLPGITGGIKWYHPHNSYQAHNGADCDGD